MTQAYGESELCFEREVYLNPPAEMTFPEGSVFKVEKPLYGIPEFGLRWYLTYLLHHLVRLGMKRSTAEPCILHKHDGNRPIGVIALQVNDSFGIGTSDLLRLENDEAKIFMHKPRIILDNFGATFNSLTVPRTPMEQYHCHSRM